MTQPRFRINSSSRPRQIYDFSGFPPSLTAVKYTPPGDPALARALVAAARAARVEAEGTEEWGLDHGAWAPLMRLLPEGDTPVVAISITQQPPETYIALGRAIRRALASWPKSIAFVGTGSILHNFDRLDSRPDARWPEGEQIENEILEILSARNDEALVSFDRKKWNTIQPEGNLGPLFTLLGVVGPDVRPRVIRGSSVMGGFGMSILEFVPA
ncbi:MAG: dioxygenase [Thermoplasmata archaeon]|nr:dioxygenase [Thermoplasmata archaeon]